MPAKLNYTASMVMLYDMVAPTAPSYVNTRNAIEKHRRGERNPVAMPVETL